jgi:hypothetical protein
MCCQLISGARIGVPGIKRAKAIATSMLNGDWNYKFDISIDYIIILAGVVKHPRYTTFGSS